MILAMARLKYVLLILLFPLLTFGADPVVWRSMSNGQHSFRNLGTQFVVNVPVKPIQGARLVLFNERFARELGLDLPSDPKELEELILRNFAFVVADSFVGAEYNNKRNWFATYYQDSKSKEKGYARGDGRALWAGELPVQRGEGHSSIDVVLKGVGETPLAWTKHSDPSHRDGLQSMREAISSFIWSEANAQNQLNTTIDLAVIEIPLTKTDHNGRIEKAAITIRLGEQTRIAHFRYWSDENGNFETIFDYSVRRALGIPLEQQITIKERERYYNELAKNLAQEAARYFDLHALHASPTGGNRTTSGATIDLGTFRYLDAHHSNYRYFFDKHTLGGEHDQTNQMRRYLEDVAKYGYEVGVDVDEKKALATFDSEFKTHLTNLWLHRLGFSESMQKTLLPSTRNAFYELFEDIHKTSARFMIPVGSNLIAPAAFEPRRVFANALAILQATGDERLALAKQALQPYRQQTQIASWSQFEQSIAPDGELAKIQTKFANDLVKLLVKMKNEIPYFNSQLPDAIARAKTINEAKRLGLGKELGQERAAPILQAIQAGKESFVEISERAMKAAESYVDPGLKVNPETNLGKKKPSVGLCADIFARGA